VTSIDLVGYSAALLTTIAFVPQAWLTWRKKKTDEISLGMYALFTTGVALWFAYGLLMMAWPIIIANGITLVLALAILVMKLTYG
jgi:MtN3 and saliva related transmembrane protein